MSFAIASFDTLIQDSGSSDSTSLWLLVLFVCIAGAIVTVFILATKKRPARAKRPTIMICGATGVGKSTLINTLVGAEIARTGPGEPITQCTVRVATEVSEFVFFDSRGLEVEDASQIYLLLMSDLLRLRFDRKPSDQIDLVLMCIQQSQGRIDDAHLEIAALCQDLNIPLGIALTKTDGPCELVGLVKDAFPDALFVRRILAREQRFRNLTIPAVGIEEIRGEIRTAALGNAHDAMRRAMRGRSAQSLAASARRLAQAGPNNDDAWVTFTRDAWFSLNMQGERWEKVLKSQRALIKTEIVPGRIKRTLNTRFDNGKINAALSRRLLPIIMRRFADESGRLQIGDLAQARKEAINSFENERPYRSRF